MSTSPELYDLFLALAPARIGAARAALEATNQAEARARTRSALVPMAVDALLLGADGIAEVARAAAEALAPRAAIARALDLLERSAEALGSGDASGARVDETALKAEAMLLRAHDPAGDEPVAHAETPAQPSADDREWTPRIGEDMIGAFLDECGERVDGLAEKLLQLEEHSDDKELVSALFRDLHTLKGSSAFAGLGRMNRVAHAAEDLVADLRSGKRAAERPVVDALLQALDVLRAILERAQRRAPIDIETSAVLARLKDPLAPIRSASITPMPSPPVATLSSASIAEHAAPVPKKDGAAAGGGTLRIEFEKVDLLLNLVGELVLARSRLVAATERHATIPQDLAELRRALRASARARGVGTDHASIEDLQRTERVLGESNGELDGGLASLGLALGQMRDHVMKLRMVPIARLFTKYQRTVRELSHKLGKEVRVELEGAETELDKVLVERLDDPLLHLVRNAIDHGVETPDVREAAGKPRAGSMRLIARQRGGSIVVAIQDDGAGMDPEKLKARAVEKGILTPAEAAAMTDRESFDLIFRAGFSTAAIVSDVSGRGVGMDVVREAITRLKGTVIIESRKGLGSTIELRLPLTLAITQVLAARVGGEAVAIPLDAVVSAQAISATDMEAVAGASTLRVGDALVPIIDLTATLGLDPTADLTHGSAEAYVVVVDVGGDLFGLLVQQLLGRHEVVIKSLGLLLTNAPFVAGATLVDDRVLLVLDLVAVTSAAASGAVRLAPASPQAKASSRGIKILIAEDSDTVREGIRRAFEARGFDVYAAVDGAEALEMARATRFDVVSTDVMMPNVDGYELARALRADPRHAKVPIVMLTSKDARLDQLRGLDAGADAYLMKPVDAGDLVRQVEALLARARSPV